MLLHCFKNSANIKPIRTNVSIATDSQRPPSLNVQNGFDQDMEEMMPAIFTVIVGSAFMTLIVKSISDDAMNK